MKIFSKSIALISITPIFLSIIGRIEDNKTSFFIIQNPLPSCWFLQTYGVPCASCGLTRGWICVAHGEIERALIYNPNSIITFFTILCISLILITISLNNYSKRMVLLLYTLIIILFLFAWTPIIEKNISLYKFYGVQFL